MFTILHSGKRVEVHRHVVLTHEASTSLHLQEESEAKAGGDSWVYAALLRISTAADFYLFIYFNLLTCTSASFMEMSLLVEYVLYLQNKMRAADYRACSKQNGARVSFLFIKQGY